MIARKTIPSLSWGKGLLFAAITTGAGGGTTILAAHMNEMANRLTALETDRTWIRESLIRLERAVERLEEKITKARVP